MYHKLLLSESNLGLSRVVALEQTARDEELLVKESLLRAKNTSTQLHEMNLELFWGEKKSKQKIIYFLQKERKRSSLTDIDRKCHNIYSIC